ncbi:BN159_2729 family protein [Streptomyces sp. YIM 98790]|uniref:BN159_2729 family protein n=1 Tax=Streptomyces sp. YIM 98790 TaxID=2689077 RepID=UPI00140E4040|nr:BN159_2729 family protein [Streptomyces sp. YIM 98790]
MTGNPSGAEAVARRLRKEHPYGTAPGLMSLFREGDRVLITVRVSSVDDWYYWLDAIGPQLSREVQRVGVTLAATASVEGVPVDLLAYGAYGPLEAAWREAGLPYLLWGRVYDLSEPLRDRTGGRWTYTGGNAAGEVPLLAAPDGGADARTLPVVVCHAGPLGCAGEDREQQREREGSREKEPQP